MTNHYDFDPLARLRLEVEAPTTGLVNLVANPSGDLGAWGWITPIATSVLLARSGGPSGTLLEYAAPSPAAASYLHTEPMAVAAGQYVGAKWETLFISGYYRARLQWLDAAFNVISSGTQTAYAQTGTASIAATLAPATTAFVRLRFDTYSNTSSGNPGAAAQFQFRNVVVAKAATAAGLGVTRTNLLANPSFETNTAEWTAGVGAFISRSTAQAQHGSASLRLQATGGRADASTSLYGLTGGRDYTVSAYLRAVTTGRPVYIAVQFYDAYGTVGIVSAVKTSSAVGSWTRFSQVVTAPATATSATVTIGVMDAINTELHYLDSVMVEEGFGLGSFVVGSQANQFLGTIALGYVNILGPTHSIRGTREAMDLGTLNVSIRDTALDPATSSAIRPGRRVRLMALDDAGVWQALFTGRTNKADVTYDLTARPDKTARIDLVAVDPNAALANATRPQGVATMADLPFVLEGCAVPWSVNGSGNQVASATVVSDNDNATALDQIAITRDSTSGFAWVDRNGVLNAYDRDQMPSALPNGSASGSRDQSRAVALSWGAIATTTYTTTQFRSSPNAFQSTAGTGGNQMLGWAVAGVPVVPGHKYRFRGYVRSAAVSRNIASYVLFAGGPVSAVPLTFTGTSTTTGWTLVEGTATAPVGAYAAQFGVAVSASTVRDFDSSAAKIPAGEVHYFDDITVSPVLDEVTYNPSLGVAFSSDDCINEVTIKAVEWDPADSTKSIEVAYGPYRDEASIREWDRHAKDFTVHGLTPTQVDALGASILSRNATPVVRVTEVTIPIKSGADLSSRALLDLYAHVHIVNGSLDHTGYVTGIEHVLTTEGWLLRLTFEPPGAVATPTTTPPVQSSGVVSDTGWIYVGAVGAPPFQGGWVNYGAGYVPVRFRRKDGVVHVQGLGKSGSGTIFTLPVGFRPAFNMLTPAIDGVNGIARTDVNANGTVVAAAGASVALWTINAIYPAEA